MSEYKQNNAGILVPESNYRVDAWANGSTGMGVNGIDSSVNTTFLGNGLGLDYQILTNLYNSDWLTRKVCMRPAKDATRKFVQFSDPDAHKLISGRFKELHLRQKIKTAIAWARLFGGAGIVMITKDSDSEEPISEGKKGNLVDIETYDKWDLTPVSYDTDVTSLNYMQPLIYQTYEGRRFHYSRICKFEGAELTRREWITSQHWGGSIINNVYDAIKHLQATYSDARYILSELNIGILKVPNLTDASVQGGPAKAIQKRVNAFNNTKSNQRVAAIDKEEEFAFVNRTVSGVAEIMEQFKGAMSAASEIPRLTLFGESPSGMNGETDGEMSTYYDNIEDIRQDQIAPCIEKIMKADGYEGNEWHFESLWEMSDKDKSLVMQQSSSAIVPLINTVLTPEEALAQLNSLSVWNIEDTDKAPDLI